MKGGKFEMEEMYPVYNEVARIQREAEAERSTRYALEAEKIHANLYEKAIEAVKSERDFEGEDIRMPYMWLRWGSSREMSHMRCS
jgi:rubrerythrin